MIARALGPYQPIERLERSGPFATYRAVDPRLFGQPVAVTVVDLPSDDAEFGQRFERAAEALTALRHPNILPLLDFGETSGQAYLATPYLEGPTLATVLGRPRRPVEALGLTATLCDALDHAHRLGLAHGGLTPDTIQLVNLPPGEDTLYAAWPILLYYGFAGTLGSAVDSSPSPYAPPEGNPGEAPIRADLYSLAGVLHVLLTGVPPAVGGDETALATLPAGLAATLRRALAADPAERFGAGSDFVLALRDASTADRRGADDQAVVLLEEARVAVTAGKLRAASEAYSAYLLLRPQDELARREFATVESRRAEVARRRAETTAASAAAAIAAATNRPPPLPAPEIVPPAAPDDDRDAVARSVPQIDTDPLASDWASVPPDSATGHLAQPARFDLRNLLSFGGNARQTQSTGVPLGPGGLGATRRPVRGAPPPALKPIAAPARQRRQAVLPAAIAAVVLLLALALGGAALARRGNQRGTSNPTAAVQTPGAGTVTLPGGATRTPTRFAANVPSSLPVAPTIAPVTPTPVPTLPPLAPVINDTFDNHASGFPLQPADQEGAGYQNGEYVLRVPDPDGLAIAELTSCVFLDGGTVPGCSFGDLTMDVDLWAVGPTAGGSYGLIFHRQFTGAYNQYFVLINPEAGTIRLIRFTDPDRVEVIKETPVAAINKGNAKNHLSVTIKGSTTSTITISVNGVSLPPVTDQGPISGLVALRADAGTGPIEAHFDNFVIRPAR